MTLPLDIHAHVASPEKEGGRRVISISPKDLHWSVALGVGGDYPCISVGLHPWQVDEEWEVMVNECIVPALSMPHVVAVGEVGLDKVKGGEWSCQIAAFKAQVMLSEQYRKPLIVHCVKGYDDLIALYKSIRPMQCWIIHGFRGKAIQAAQLTRMGFSLSFGEHFCTEAVCACPLDRLFVESDESLLPLDTLYARIAEAKGVSVGRLEEQVRKNVEGLFLKSV